MRWIYFPPVFSFVLLIITALLHDRTAATPLPPAIWGMTVAAYITLCALSIFHIARNDKKYNAGTFSLTQGLMLVVLSLQFGVRALSWIGFIIFIVGLILIFYYATHNTAYVETVPTVIEDSGPGPLERADGLIEKLELPICYTDNAGTIIWATTSFCEALGKYEEDVLGNAVNKFIPIEDEEMVLESGKWGITQKKEGSRYYFSLKPLYDEVPAPPPVLEPSGEVLIYDKGTGLYTDEYRKIRGPEEVSRAQRYKRPLSGLLLSLTFEPSSTVKMTKEQENMLSDAFKSRVQAALRTTDCGFLMSDGRIQILLPETPQVGGKTLLSRMIVMPQDVFDEEIRTAVNPRVSGGMFFYNGTTRMEYGIFSAALEEAISKNIKSAIVPAPNTQAA